jgi:hypothetical protein
LQARSQAVTRSRRGAFEASDALVEGGDALVEFGRPITAPNVAGAQQDEDGDGGAHGLRVRDFCPFSNTDQEFRHA